MKSKTRIVYRSKRYDCPRFVLFCNVSKSRLAIFTNEQILEISSSFTYKV